MLGKHEKAGIRAVGFYNFFDNEASPRFLHGGLIWVDILQPNQVLSSDLSGHHAASGDAFLAIALLEFHPGGGEVFVRCHPSRKHKTFRVPHDISLIRPDSNKPCPFFHACPKSYD
mgnify:CR=1 FL=1